MNQSFNSRFQFDEGTIVCDTDNLATDSCSNFIFFLDRFPGIVTQLLEAQGHFLVIWEILKNQNFNFVSDSEHFRRMYNPAPGHIGDVQQAIHTP